MVQSPGKSSLFAFVRETLHRTNIPSPTLGNSAARFESPYIGRTFCEMFKGVQTINERFIEPGKVQEPLSRTMKRSSNWKRVIGLFLKTRSLQSSIGISACHSMKSACISSHHENIDVKNEWRLFFS
jgi:hypothetical protein